MKPFETILTDRKANLVSKPPQYNVLHGRNLPQSCIRQQSCPKSQTVQVLFGRNKVRDGARSHQNSCHRIRVSRGRLPQDFFGRVEMQRINTVDANINHKNEYVSLDTPTFASRADKLKQKSRIDFIDEVQKGVSLFSEGVYIPSGPKRMRSFFNTQSQRTLAVNENRTEDVVIDISNITNADVKLAQYRATPQQANTINAQQHTQTLSTAYNSKIHRDEAFETASGIESTNQFKHQSAPESHKNKPRKQALKQRFRNFFLNETVELQSSLLKKQQKYPQSFPEARKRIRQGGLREDFFQIPNLKFPQSQKNSDTNGFNYLKSSILPPLHQK